MKTEWKKVRLGDIATVTSSKRVFANQYTKTGIPFYRQKEIIEKNRGEELSEQLFISNDLYRKMKMNYGVPQKNDLLITGVGVTLGIPYLVKDETFYFKDGNLIWLKDISENVNSQFIFYYINSAEGQKTIWARTIGSAQPALTIDLVKQFQFPCPSLETQQKIAGILSAYDDLIENNRKQIKLLEEAAQKLYKEWFVKLNFPGHENVKIVDGVSEGWKKEKLINLVDVQYGYAFDGSKFNSEGNGKPIIRIRNIPQGTTDDFTTEQTTDDYIVHNGDIVVGMDGEFHINTWNQNDAYLVQRVCSFRPHNENMKGYILQAIYAPIKFFENTVVGATVAHLGKKHIDTIEVLTCNEEFYIPFQNMVRKRQTLLNQIQLLQSARDKLLPKLMNGEVEV